MAPISVKEMESGKAVEIGARSARKEQVLKILSEKNKDGKMQAWRQGEIAARLQIGSPHARTILMDLTNKGIVVRKDMETNDGKKAVFYALKEQTSK
jgi:Mn-dependent DtxR family transcriptional regulator